MELEHARRELVLLEAETERRRVEEESKVRIREAEIEAEVVRRSLHAKWQEIQLELVAEMNRLQHERALKVVEVQGKVLSKAAKLWQLEELGIYSRRRAEPTVGGLEDTLKEGLNNLIYAIEQPRVNPILEQIPELDGRTTFWMRIAAELAEISELEVVQGCYLEMGKQDGKGHLILQLGDRRLDICCHPGYPQVPPDVRWADNGLQPVSFDWSEDMSLKCILGKIQANTDGHV
jgi:hypothetical protein